MNQRIVADVIELGLHLLPIVRGHEREFVVHLAEHSKDALVEFADHVAVEDDLLAAV